MRKLYTFLFLLFTFSLLSNAQSGREELKDHPIVGVWYFEGLVANVCSDNETFNDQVSKIIGERIDHQKNEMRGSYLVFTKQGRLITVEQKHNLTEFVVEVPTVGTYSLTDSLIIIDHKGRRSYETYNYEFQDDCLYLIPESMEIQEMEHDIQKSPVFKSVEGIDSIEFTIEAKIKLTKSTAQLTDLDHHPIACCTWMLEDVIYELDMDTDEEEEYSQALYLLESSFRDKVSFWVNVLHFGTDGGLYNLTLTEAENLHNQMIYFMLNDKTITVIPPYNEVYSVDFSIEDDLLELTISDLEGDLGLYATLEREKLPLVKKAAIRIVYRSVK